MVDLSHLLIDVENQRHYGSCFGNAFSTYLEACWKRFDDQAKEFSAAYAWQMAKGERYAENIGVSAAAGFLACKKYGCALDADYPYTDENLTRKPTPEEIKKAKANRISGSKLLMSDQEIIQTLDKGLPVFLFVDMGGGHFVCCFGYRYMNGELQLLIVNSWGVEWMDKGKAWINRAGLKLRMAYVITGLKWQWLKNAKKWFRGMFK